MLSALALLAALSARSSGRQLALLGLAAVTLLALLGFLRLHTLEIACVAIGGTVLLSPRPRPFLRLSGAAALLACVPLAFGMGVGGGSFVANSRDLGEQRSLNATQAATAVTAAPAGAAVTAAPAGARKAQTTPKQTSPTNSTAAPGRTSPPESAAPAEQTSPTTSALRYLPTGVAILALRPWPWETSSGHLGIYLARAETVIWYPLLLLAAVGMTTVWRHRRTLAFPVLAGGAILAMYGLTEGNLGTAYRHRGELVWVVALLAALGAARIAAWRATVTDPAVLARPA